AAWAAAGPAARRDGAGHNTALGPAGLGAGPPVPGNLRFPAGPDTAPCRELQGTPALPAAQASAAGLDALGKAVPQAGSGMQRPVPAAPCREPEAETAAAPAAGHGLPDSPAAAEDHPYPASPV
ncbi:hypothetical protein BGX30_003395, partial [Mortierella sp. GBA39]